MNSRKFILLLVLSILAVSCHAQNDSLTKSDTCNIKVSLFTSNKINFSKDFSDHRETLFNHKLYNPDIYKYRDIFDPVSYNNWLYGSVPDRYSKFSQNKFYRYDRISYWSMFNSTDAWYDPTNPWNVNSPTDAVITGTLNYVLWKIFSSE